MRIVRNDERFALEGRIEVGRCVDCFVGASFGDMEVEPG